MVIKAHPAIVILNLNLPDMEVSELCQRILKRAPEMKIHVLSAYFEGDLIYSCIKSSVKGLPDQGC